jgi:hypothetical protein
MARLAIDKEAEVKEADADFEAGQGWQINDGCRECELKVGFDIAVWDILLETVRIIITELRRNWNSRKMFQSCKTCV